MLAIIAPNIAQPIRIPHILKSSPDPVTNQYIKGYPSMVIGKMGIQMNAHHPQMLKALMKPTDRWPIAANITIPAPIIVAPFLKKRIYISLTIPSQFNNSMAWTYLLNIKGLPIHLLTFIRIGVAGWLNLHHFTACLTCLWLFDA